MADIKPKNFNHYLKKNKAVGITYDEYDGVSIKFENGKIIDIIGGVDGLYAEFRRKPKKNASRKLVEELMALTPSFLKMYETKYGTESDLWLSDFLKPETPPTHNK